MSSDPPQTNGTTNGAISSTEYFQAIGAQVDQVAPATNGAEPADDDVKPVEEIESLCMNCHEDVRQILSQRILCKGYEANGQFAGCHTPPLDQDSLLPRNYHHVLLLRPLWLSK